MIEPTITISVSEYNRLVRNQIMNDPTSVVERPKKRKVIKRIINSIFSFRKNIKQQQLIKLCIQETYNIMYSKITGYWGSCINDDMRDNLCKFEQQYKQSSYDNIMRILNKSK